MISREILMAAGWIFLILISVDYLMEFRLNLLMTKEELVKTLLVYLGLSLILGKLWLLFLVGLNWLLDSVLGVIFLVIMGITLVIVGPMLLVIIIL